MSSDTDAQMTFQGTVVAVQANFYRVQFGPQCPAHELLCTKRAVLKKIGQSVMVGDRVQVTEPDWAGGRGAICQVLPRRAEMARPPIANADQILLLFSLSQPSLDPFQLTKFLITAEQTQMEVVLGLSKADLVDDTIHQDWCDRLQEWGYQAISLSLVTGQGIDDLNRVLQDKLTVLSGPSGVGKSSLLNFLKPELNVRTGAVSERYHQGRHTTRHVELFDLGAGLLADSPGFNQPSLEIEPAMLASLFPEIRKEMAVGACQFSDCLHRDEPNCCVSKNWERRDFYLQILDDLIEKFELNQQKGKGDRQQKIKSGSSGTVNYEPRLEAKKYRRQSRRRQHQALEDYYDEELSQTIGSLE